MKAILSLLICSTLFACSNSKKAISDNPYLFSNSAEDVAKHLSVLKSGKWKLIEVNGQPVDSVNGQIPYIKFDESGKAGGTAGCNTFSTNFKIDKGNKISFSPVISTRMACADMSVEDRLFPVLTEADNYTLTEYELTLNKAKMSPLAKFARMRN
ncbi:MAG: META domain-containing protein [Bacteroidetes bacterium]|nr:META domain-containing protein [Bacteroidota bacterium]